MSLDYAGSFPATKDVNKKFRYIRLAVDHFTAGYLVTIPTSSNNGATTARAVMDKIICKYGVPRRIHSDRETSFKNTLMADLGLSLGIKLSTTSAFHPQGNGKTERYVGLLKQTIHSILQDHQDN